MGHMCVTDVSTNKMFILPALPIRGLPVSKEQLDRMKLVWNLTIPIMLP